MRTAHRTFGGTASGDRRRAAGIGAGRLLPGVGEPKNMSAEQYGTRPFPLIWKLDETSSLNVYADCATGGIRVYVHGDGGEISEFVLTWTQAEQLCAALSERESE